MIDKRIGNLQIRKATYLCEEPKNPSYHIDYWYPNGYYGRENEFIKDGDWYLYPENYLCRVHKDCFKNKQSCMAIASFDYNDGSYEIKFVGDRPISLHKEEREIFWELLEFGYKKLNNEEK